MSISITTRRFSKLLGFGSLFAALSASAFAVTAVSSAGFNEQNVAAGTTVADYVGTTDLYFANNSLNLTSVTTSSGLHAFSSSTIGIQSVDFRAGGSVTTSVNLRTISPGTTQATQFSSFSELLGNGNNNMAVSNALQDIGGSGYERIDVSFTSGHVVTANDVIVLFGLGVNFNQSSFLVAGLSAAMAAGSNGLDAVYVDTGHVVSTSSFGGNLGARDYYNVVFGGSDISGTGDSISSTRLSTSGVVIYLTDLGFAVGDVMNGFSIMGADVKANTAADLANYNNDAVFLENTSSSMGGLDFTSFNVGTLSPVPEPSTYGAMLTLGSLGFFAWRRRRAARAA